MRRALASVAMLAMALSAQQASAQRYVRGDVGGAFSTQTTFTDVTSDATPLLGSGVQISGGSGNSVIFGAGIGYKLTPLLRTDLTLSYLPLFQFKGTGNLGPGTTETADVRSFVGLLNGYLDLNGLAPGLFGGFQPYLQAGVGLARNDMGPTNLSIAGAGATVSRTTHTNVVWGAGAGVAYAVAPNVLLDLAYKYLDLGEMRTGTTVSALGATALVGATKANLEAHTVTLGVRVGF